MKVKEFSAFNLVPQLALRNLSNAISTFLKEDKSLMVISLSHAIAEIESTNVNEKFIATALLCYN